MEFELIYEDEAYERAFLSGKLLEAEAVVAVGSPCALTSVTTLRASEDAVREYISRYPNAPFSTEAKGFLANALASLFRECGYSASADSPDETITFETCRKLNLSVFAGEVAPIWCSGGDGERYDFSLLEGGEDDGNCALILRGRTVLCAAGINDLRRDGYSEIYVECAPEYRRRGYASACVALLVSKLIDDGQRVRYETSADNTASVALARKLGFEELEHTASFFALGQAD